MSGLALSTTFGTRSELALILGTLGILMVLFTPIPPGLLDFLLIVNFSFGLLLLLLTFYVDKPLGFSTFPSLLLIATLFRLSLNVAATRLILSHGDAGQVINAIGSYVVGGNYVIGLVVFLILIVVQYVVVTSGAQRVAEVAARFTLDSMPGKQMSIDADMNMGLIDEKEARERRKNVEKEASFYGAMDGASKFVKGDAVAGIIIILINIIGGLTIGIAQHGLDWSEALRTYTLLTIGDGIITQIPALVISTATGIIITRAATDSQLGDEISSQVARYPKSLVIIGVGLTGMLFLPALPKLPIFIMVGLVALLAFFAFRQQGVVEEKSEETKNHEESDDLYSDLRISPVEVSVGKGLVTLLGGEGGFLMEEIKRLRKQLAFETGFVLPTVRVQEDTQQKERCYQIRIQGSKVAEGELYPGMILAISARDVSDKVPGIAVKDPTYGLPAVWVEPERQELAKKSGCTLVDPLTVALTQFSEVVRNHAPLLLTRSAAEQLVARVRKEQPSLYDELIPNTLTLSDVQKVLQQLLQEKVSVRNIELILEALVDQGKTTKDHDLLTEHVRQKLGSEICQSLVKNGSELHVLSFDSALEQALQSGLRSNEQGVRLLLDPVLTERMLTQLAQNVEKMMRENMQPALICSPSLRRHIRRLSSRLLPQLTVLALTEIPSTINIRSYGVVKVDRNQLQMPIMASAQDAKEIKKEDKV